MQGGKICRNVKGLLKKFTVTIQSLSQERKPEWMVLTKKKKTQRKWTLQQLKKVNQRGGELCFNPTAQDGPRKLEKRHLSPYSVSCKVYYISQCYLSSDVYWSSCKDRASRVLGEEPARTSPITASVMKSSANRPAYSSSSSIVMTSGMAVGKCPVLQSMIKSCLTVEGKK